MKILSFKETQRFKQIWIWLVIIGIAGLFGWGFVQQIILDKPWGTEPASDTALILFSLFPVGLLILFLTARLKTEIKESGIYFKFFPFHFKQHKIEWSTVDKAFVRKYKPIAEYGGWGIRLGLFGKGKAFNVSGNNGIQIVLTNGKQILFGTNKPDEAKEVLRQSGHLTE